MKEKVSRKEKFSYFLANVGNIPLMTLLSSFFLIYYTDVIGLRPEALATLFLISKVMDSISDPVMGFLLDKFPVTKMGKFRPMLILGTVICVINYILLWFGAAWSPVGKYVIVYVTYLLLGWTFDMMDISLNSLLPVMTTDNRERNTLSMLKGCGYVLGGAVILIAGPIIVASGTLESYYILIFGSMAVTLVFSIVGALGVKERIGFDGKEEEKYTFRELIGFLLSKPVFIYFAASLMYSVGSNAATAANTFFYTYMMDDLTLMSGVSMVSMVAMIPGMLAAPVLANRFGKKAMYVFGLFAVAAGAGIRIFAPVSLPLIYVGALIGAIGGGTIMTLGAGVSADNTMYVQYKTGKRAEAAVASLGSFVTKIAQGVGGALPGYILAAFGYVNKAAVQPDSIHTGIVLCVIVIPAVLNICGGLIFASGYQLGKKEVDEMAQAIAEKNQQA